MSLFVWDTVCCNVQPATELEDLTVQNVTWQAWFVYLHPLAMTSLSGTVSATSAVAGSGWAELAPRAASTWPDRYFRCRDRRRWRRRRMRRCRRGAEVERHLAASVECWRWREARGHYCRSREHAPSRTPSDTGCFPPQPLADAISTAVTCLKKIHWLVVSRRFNRRLFLEKKNESINSCQSLLTATTLCAVCF